MFDYFTLELMFKLTQAVHMVAPFSIALFTNASYPLFTYTVGVNVECAEYEQNEDKRRREKKEK